MKQIFYFPLIYSMFKMHIQPDRKKLQILEWKERDNNKTTTPGKQITPALLGRKKIENIENMMTSVEVKHGMVGRPLKQLVL